jgi:hypothetical protein
MPQRFNLCALRQAATLSLLETPSNSLPSEGAIAKCCERFDPYGGSAVIVHEKAGNSFSSCRRISKPTKDG